MRLMLRRFPNLPHGGLARHVAVLAGGTALAQALNLVASPVLSRLYSPAEFGILAVYTSVLTFLSIVASWRYEQAIPLPEKDEGARSLVKLALLILIVMSVLTTLLIWVWPNQVVSLLRIPSLAPFLWLLPAGLLGIGAYQVGTYWATRKRGYSLIARTKLIQQLCGQFLITIPLGLLKVGPLGLLIGSVASQVAGIGSLFRFLLTEKAFRPSEGELGVWQVAWQYRKFPMVSTFSGIVNVIGMQVPILYLSFVFSPDVVGHYAMANRVLGLPAALVGQAVAQVFYPHAAQTQDPKRLQELSERLGIALLALGLPVFSVIMTAGPQLFRVIFGPEWQTAGDYARLLAPWFVVLLVSSPLSTLSLVKQRQGLAFGIALYELALRLGLMWIGGRGPGSARWTIGMLTVAGFIISAVSISVMLHLIGSSIKKVLGRALRTLVPVLPAMACLFVLTRLVGDVPVFVASGIAVLGLLYLLRKPILELTTL